MVEKKKDKNKSILKSFKNHSLVKIKESVKEKKFEDLTLNELFDFVDFLIEDNIVVESKKIISYIIKYQNKNGEFEEDNILIPPTYFLMSISKYLKNVEIKTRKKEFKFYLKIILKSIKYLIKNFDEDFLLIKNLTNYFEFNLYENVKFIEASELLCEILNEFDYNKYADKLFLIKEKVNLGIERYFIKNFSKNKQNKKKIVLKDFSRNGDFNYLEDIELLQLNFEFRKKYDLILSEKNLIEILNNKFIEEKINFIHILLILKEMKIKNYKKFRNEILKEIKLIKEFPKIIIKKEKYEEIKSIKTSINKNYNEEIKVIDNYVLLEVLDLNLISFVYSLIKDE